MMKRKMMIGKVETEYDGRRRDIHIRHPHSCDCQEREQGVKGETMSLIIIPKLYEGSRWLRAKSFG
jgi:hypothetical protein